MKKLQPVKLLTFCFSVYALSLFFEAGRVMGNEQTFGALPTSVFSALAFFISLLILGYFIYEDEKNKNNLRVEFGLYEWMYKRVHKVEGK